MHAQSGGSSSIGFLDCQGDELQASERKRGCGVIDRVSGQVWVGFGYHLSKARTHPDAQRTSGLHSLVPPRYTHDIRDLCFPTQTEVQVWQRTMAYT